MGTAEAGDWIDSWLSVPRFAVYLRAAGHDRRTASALYEWNAQVAAVFHHDLAHLEVGLRNAYDRALCEGAPDHGTHWVFEPLRHFPPQRHKAVNGRYYDANETSRRLIAEAIKNATARPKASRSDSVEAMRPSPGKVIAELSFGFWRYLSIRRQHDSLWIPHLHRAFRPGTSRQAVDRPIASLHNLRNRVAHHEPLFTVDLAGRHRDLLALADLISAELAAYITTKSWWPDLLATRPPCTARTLP